MNIIGDLSVWIIVWWLVEILILVLVLIRNNLMGKQNKKQYVLDKWEKHSIVVIVVIIGLIVITGIFKNDDVGRYVNSVLYAVLFFTGALWISRKFNDDTNEKLRIIDDTLKRIEEKLDILHKK